MDIFERVENLRKMMSDRKIDAYIIPTSDPHQSEYLPDYYKTREFISGFTGSAGTAVVTMEKAGLWTDGRYFVQAEKELKNTPFKLYRMGEDIDYTEFIVNEVPSFGKVAFDGKCLSLSQYTTFTEKFGDRLLITDVDYISEIWKDRPELPKDEVFIFDEKYTGASIKQKLEVLRAMMKDRDLDYVFIGALEDIAYLYNLRGNDIYATPVFISFALVSKEKASLFINPNKLDEEVLSYLNENDIDVYEYDHIYQVVNEIKGQNTIFLDPTRTNVKLYKQINKNVKIQKGTNLTTLMKALKNDVEIANSKKAFNKDARALVRFFNWVETGVSTGNINEVMASNKLLDLRNEEENFLEPSFETISAYGENAAMPHYDPNKGEPKVLKKRGLYLVDSGGHYLEGTTDITRVLALGDLTDDERTHYTLVLKGHISAMSAKFTKGTTGMFLDSVCRYPILKEGLDFNHGTGHGVGFVLGVHEGPMSISRRDQGVSLEEGMVFSIEPGIYIEGSHGIRIENIVFVKKSEKEGFLELEPFSYVPIDTRPVKRYLLDDSEIEWLNNYNKECRKRLEDSLAGSELEYLEMITKEI
ncbi:MAG: aminopeptidase P family protein [Tissierellia bacterium]|nr:aminopeptidase P family protein [Tissierellia bacterium]